MTHPTDPSFPNDPSAQYKSAADEFPTVLAESSSETDEEDEEGSAGEGGGKAPKKYKVFLDPILDFADDADLTDAENAAEKLKKFEISSMSLLASGASAFASENDLSRKAFMAKVGIANGEITARDIADPKMFQKLDAKQAERRSRFGIRTLDEIVTGAIETVGAAITFVSSSVSEYVKDKKEDRKASRLARNFEEGSETYSLDHEDDYASRSSLEEADFPVQDFQGDELVAMERDRLYDDLSRKTQFELDQGNITYSEAFNRLADIILLSQQPVRTVTLSSDLHIGQDNPGADKELNPMGG